MFIDKKRFYDLENEILRQMAEIKELGNKIKTLEEDNKTSQDDGDSVFTQWFYSRFVSSKMTETKPIKLKEAINLIMKHLNINIKYVKGTNGEYKVEQIKTAKIRKPSKK